MYIRGVSFLLMIGYLVRLNYADGIKSAAAQFNQENRYDDLVWLLPVNCCLGVALGLGKYKLWMVQESPLSSALQTQLSTTH
jgi:hypothetical protein